MWWVEVQSLADDPRLHGSSQVDQTAEVEPGVTLDDRAGPIVIGARSRVCAGAILRGPLAIGEDSLVGNYATIRGPTRIGDGVRIGFAAELKQAIVADRVMIGPQCYVADSKVDEDAYLGAQVRTSNHRLDRRPIRVRVDGDDVDTGMEKLGCWIGRGVSLGIQVIVLPGRVIAAGSTFEPRVTVSRNYPAGHYRVAQAIETVPAREAS